MKACIVFRAQIFSISPSPPPPSLKTKTIQENKKNKKNDLYSLMRVCAEISSRLIYEHLLYSGMGDGIGFNKTINCTWKKFRCS
jgi:hypothetical protein